MTKYCLIKRMNYWKEYMYQYNILRMITGHNIYVCSFQDACSYVTKDLLNYYLLYCKNISLKYKCEDKLKEYGKYILLPGNYIKPKNLREFEYIYVNHKNSHLEIKGDVINVNFETKENLLLSHLVQKVVKKIINGEKIDCFYSFPVQKIEIKIKSGSNKKYHEYHHFRRAHCMIPRKRELALSHDVEVREYLDARNMFKGKFWRHKGIRHNKHNYIPGDWKHRYKCHKQWAKSIENPSYKKLSKEIWKQELKEIETDEIYT